MAIIKRTWVYRAWGVADPAGHLNLLVVSQARQETGDSYDDISCYAVPLATGVGGQQPGGKRGRWAAGAVHRPTSHRLGKLRGTDYQHAGGDHGLAMSRQKQGNIPTGNLLLIYLPDTHAACPNRYRQQHTAQNPHTAATDPHSTRPAQPGSYRHFQRDIGRPRGHHAQAYSNSKNAGGGNQRLRPADRRYDILAAFRNRQSSKVRPATPAPRFPKISGRPKLPHTPAASRPDADDVFHGTVNGEIEHTAGCREPAPIG